MSSSNFHKALQRELRELNRRKVWQMGFGLYGIRFYSNMVLIFADPERWTKIRNVREVKREQGFSKNCPSLKVYRAFIPIKEGTRDFLEEIPKYFEGGKAFKKPRSIPVQKKSKKTKR